MDPISLASARLACTLSPLGAELQSLTGRDGRQWLWDGDARYWSGRAPDLFPNVGMIADGAYRWQGRRYALEKHGFARRRSFELVERDCPSATLRLAADGTTRAVYPFEFELDLTFALDVALTVSASVRNLGPGRCRSASASARRWRGRGAPGGGWSSTASRPSRCGGRTRRGFWPGPSSFPGMAARCNWTMRCSLAMQWSCATPPAVV